MECGWILIMESKAQAVFDAAMEGGSTISGLALSAAIRKALLECTDSQGKLSVSELYNLTCKLERISL